MPAVTSEAFKINLIVLLVALLAKYSIMMGYFGGIALILYLCLRALTDPFRGFLLVIGTKLTFDILWFLRTDIVALPGLLELFIIPVVVVILRGSGTGRLSIRWPIVYGAIFVLLIIFARLSNQLSISIEMLIRQAGIVLGLLLGLSYVKKTEHLEQLIYLIFISTIIPVGATAIQYITHSFGVEILYYKMSAVRGYRISGFNYDPATTGMICIISLLSNTYLLQANKVSRPYRRYHILLAVLALFSVIIGSTRSIIFVAFSGIAFLALQRFGFVLKSIPVAVFLLLTFGRPYLETTLDKTEEDLLGRKLRTHELLTDEQYRTMLSGRVGLWQDIWDRFSSSSFTEKLWGTGLSSNAHSTYFFLLLQVGLLGLTFYCVFHAKLLVTLWKIKMDSTHKSIAALSLVSLLLIGFSLTTVAYTSFQWIVYIFVGGVLNIGYEYEIKFAKPGLASKHYLYGSFAASSHGSKYRHRNHSQLNTWPELPANTP